MKTFDTLQQLEEWVQTQQYDRFSPYEIIDINRDELRVMFIRVD